MAYDIGSEYWSDTNLCRQAETYAESGERGIGVPTSPGYSDQEVQGRRREQGHKSVDGEEVA